MKLFQNLFKPKWKNKDPEVRKAGLLELDPASNQAIFLEIVKQDDVPELRLLAVKRLSNLKELQNIAETHEDSKVRDQAGKMLNQAFAGENPALLAPDKASELLSSLENQNILEYIAQNGKTPALRKLAIEKISRDALLGDLACKESDPALRKLAAEKIAQKSTLERVFKKTKTKDKVVSGLVKAKLDEIIRAEEEPKKRLEKQKQLCLQLESLGKKGLWEREKSQYDNLLEQWREIPEHTSELSARFENASRQFEEAYQAYLRRHEERLKQEAELRPIQEQKQSIIEQLHDLFKQVSELSDEEVITIFDNKHKELIQSWNGLQQLPADLEEELKTQFNDINQSVKQRIKQHIKTQELSSSFEKLSRDLEKLIKQPRRLTEKTLVNIESEIRRTFSLTYSESSNQQKSELYALLQKAENNLKNKEAQIQSDFKKLKTELGQMEEKLAKGLLKEALGVRKNVTQVLEKLDKLGHKGLEEYKRQVNSVSNQINELSGWRSWANTPVKEELCERVEALIDSDEDPKNIAFIIKQAREEWKKFGPAERDASQELWERFNNACEKAYEPCKTYFEQDYQEKLSNYEVRKAFVENLETFIDTADWENVDWKKVESLFRHSRNEWRGLGQTTPKQRKELNKRFYDAFEKLKTELNKEWERNRLVKLEIVEKAKALVGEVELESAITGAKALQDEWKKAGRVPQKQERELWAEFRQACDAVFARRDAIKQEAAEALSEKANQKTELLQRLDTIVQSDLALFTEQRSDFEKTLQELKSFGDTVKKQDEHINKKLQEILDIYERKIESAGRMKDVQHLSNLQNAILKLEALEELIETNQSAVHISESVGTVRDALDDAKLPTEWMQHVEQRLDTNIKTASTQSFAEALQASFDAAAEDKRCNAILLEIIANVDSPADLANERMQIQTQRLSDKLQNQEEEDDWQRFVSIESNWWLAGPTPKEQLEDYKKRRANALDQLKNEYTEELKNYH